MYLMSHAWQLSAWTVNKLQYCCLKIYIYYSIFSSSLIWFSLKLYCIVKKFITFWVDFFSVNIITFRRPRGCVLYVTSYVPYLIFWLCPQPQTVILPLDTVCLAPLAGTTDWNVFRVFSLFHFSLKYLVHTTTGCNKKNVSLL